MANDKRTIFESMDPLPTDANGYCYRDEEHYKFCFEAVAKRLISKHGRLIDRVPWLRLLVLVSFLCVIVLLMISKYSTAGYSFVYLFLYFILIWFMFRVRRFSKTVIKHHMCFKCGYSLRKTPTDDDGYGKCSECGEQFNAGYYRKLPLNYKRSLLGVLPTHWTDSVHPLDLARMQDDESQTTDI